MVVVLLEVSKDLLLLTENILVFIYFLLVLKLVGTIDCTTGF